MHITVIAERIPGAMYMADMTPCWQQCRKLCHMQLRETEAISSDIVKWRPTPRGSNSVKLTNVDKQKFGSRTPMSAGVRE